MCNQSYFDSIFVTKQIKSLRCQLYEEKNVAMAKPSGMEAKPSVVGAKPSGTREAPTPGRQTGLM